jgi:RND superfamily putative drug exporter
MERWTRVIIRFRWPVLAFWLVVLLAGGIASGKLSALLSNTFTMPGTDSERARTILEQHYGDRSDGAFTVVYRVGNADDRVLRVRLQQGLDRGAREVPTGLARPGRPCSLRRHRLPARPGGREGLHGRHPPRASARGRRPPLRHRPGGDPA